MLTGENLLVEDREFLGHLDATDLIPDCLNRICSHFGVDYAVYYQPPQEGVVGQMPYVQTNFPATWLRQYLIKNYFDIDPVLKTGIGQKEPVDWSDIDWSNKDAAEFHEDSLAHGIGPQGYVIPMSDGRQRRSLLSLCSTMDSDAWKKLVQRCSAAWGICAQIVHNKASVELFGIEDERPSLSPRELECLYWVAQGKDAVSIAAILSISEHTVRDYSKSAKLKLGCLTLTQAVHKATLLHLIDDSNRRS